MKAMEKSMVTRGWRQRKNAERMAGKMPALPGRHASHGQALIIAVLIMFLLIGLSGLFIAIISRAITQTARAEERDKLEAIAMAGLNNARSELLTSTDGADWRADDLGPDQNNPGWIHIGEGFYKVSVHYGPQDEPGNDQKFLENPTERYLKLDVEARFTLKNPPDFIDDTNPERQVYEEGYRNPKRFMTRKISALVPIGLTDNLLWVTNQDGSSEPIVLGSDIVLQDDYAEDDPSITHNLTVLNLDPFTASVSDLENTSNWKGIPSDTLSYLSIMDGPIRVDGNAMFGNLGVFLSTAEDNKVYRSDRIVVTGNVKPFGNGIAKAALNYQSLADCSRDESGNITFGNLTTDTYQTLASNPLIKPLEAPRLDQLHGATGTDRYRTLTRDSGYYDKVKGIFTGATAEMDSATSLDQYEGLYINNPDHVQFPGDQQKLFDEWTSVDTPDENSCWKEGVYDPVGNDKAVEVTLHDWERDSMGNWLPPYLSLRSKSPILYDWDNQLTDHTVRPYPRNGVIFAEGNLVVKGSLPASVDYDGDGTNPGGLNPRTGNIQYYVSPKNRRFDLTIVSGGTIYIEGSLLSPSSRTDPDTAGYIEPGSAIDSKLALMAMDNVCLNPTRRFDVISSADPDGMNTEMLHARPGSPSGATSDPIIIKSSMAGSAQRAAILLRHAGQALSADSYCIMSMGINGTHYIWDQLGAESNKDQFLLCTDQMTADPLWSSFTEYQKAPPTVPITNSAMYPGSLAYNMLSGSSLFNLFNGYGAVNTIEFNVENGNTDYLLSPGDDINGPGFSLTGMDLQVDALVYAQRGSWFVIPGRYDDNASATRGAWKEGVSYNVDDTVFAQSTTGIRLKYRCKSDHISFPDTQPEVGVNWIAQWEQDSPKPPFSFPQYHEPLDIRIVVNGAIVENRPAPIMAEEESIKHWRGANMSYFASGSNISPDLLNPPVLTYCWDLAKRRWINEWANRRMGIEYHYDATLSKPVCYTVETVDGITSYNYLPRLPKLPVSSTLFSFGGMRGV